MGKKNGRKTCLSIGVALSLLAGGAVEARDHQNVIYDGYQAFDIIYFDAADHGTWVKNIWKTLSSDKNRKVLNYHFTDDLKSWMYDAGEQWAEILQKGLPDIKSPGQLIVGNSNVLNAMSYNISESQLHPDTFKNAVQGRVKLDYMDFVDEDDFENYPIREYTLIEIGQGVGLDQGDGNYGWYGDAPGQLFQKFGTVNLTATMFHELAHSLGIYASVLGNRFTASASNPLDYSSHLLDENKNPARAGQYIVDPTKANDAEKENYNDHPETYFQVSSMQQLDPSSRQGRAFFTGANVTEALGGKKFWDVDGIPILGIEGGIPNLSHIELERSLMSHQNYRSYVTFMEAELALMQDIGYTIDRKNFYGTSIYKSDEIYQNTRGFFARNDEGTDYITGKPNTAALGVGLHIYGSHNTVTQTRGDTEEGSADLLACGVGAAGIRIDGIDNHVTLAKDVSVKADGENGTGILVAYGRDHDVNVKGHVSAMGDAGDAVRFDFGCGMFSVEYRGSFIRYGVWSNALINGTGYITSEEDMQPKKSFNLPMSGANYLHDASFTDHVDGDLLSKMGSLTVSGSLAGKNHAIYIANNAFVDNINIEAGAQISGDMTSDWKHFDASLFSAESSDREKLQIQYGTKSHDYDEYCSDLVTHLNVNGDFEYDGNITGSDNMKLKINAGAMAYTGTADVIGVQVAEGASLCGGRYKVNEIEKYASFEPVDEEAGKLINHGTIGSLTDEDNMVIDGNLESDGVLLRRSNGATGRILVSGKAELQAGSRAVVDRGGIPGESLDVLQAAEGVTGAENTQLNSVGLLHYTASLSEDGTYLMADAHAKDTLAGATPQQAEDYQNLSDKAPDLSKDPGAEKELRIFYGLDSDARALKVIDEIGTNDRTDPAAALLLAQGSTVHARALSARLATVTGTPSLPEEASVWVKFNRHWGQTAGGSDATGNTITIGYDRKHGANRLSGFFGSYTDSGYSHLDGSETLQDTRLGYYTGMHKGRNTQLLYADFGYLDGDRSRNAVFDALGTQNLVTADYTGWLVEIGGEWKHDLHDAGERTWQVSPYGAFQMSYMKQHGYREAGSLKAYQVSGGHNIYTTLEGGVEFARPMPKGHVQFRVGLNHALTGTDYETYETNILGKSFRKSSRMDKTHLVSSLSVETELAPHWDLGAELAFQKGAHDRDVMAGIRLSRRW